MGVGGGRVRKLLFAPEEMTVTKVFDFPGEGGLIGASSVFKNPVNG